MSQKNKKRLGRGLEALLGRTFDAPEGSPDGSLPEIDVNDREAAEGYIWLPIDQIEPSPFQPRSTINPADLQSLVQSIKEHGVLQPIMVRRTPKGYQLVAGERRLRAAELAGLKEVPARVIQVDDQRACEIALVENIQRADLNPIEKARAFKNYLETFGGTQAQLAKRIGIDQATISNFIRLLELPAEIQKDVELGRLSMGQARALLGIKDEEDQLELAKRIVVEKWSVRKVEKYVAAYRRERNDRPTAGKASIRTPHIDQLEDLLSQHLGTVVVIKMRKKQEGQIVIEFRSEEDFERIIEAIMGRPYEDLVK